MQKILIRSDECVLFNSTHINTDAFVAFFLLFFLFSSDLISILSFQQQLFLLLFFKPPIPL
jgi:hypothetical protein